MARNKKEKLPPLPKDQKVKCNSIIHTASVAAGGAGTGLAQVPLADNAIITPIQITMIVSLGKVFDKRVTETAAKAIIASAAASIAGRSVSQVLFGWIPFLGNTINTATAAGLTEAIGWIAVDHFRRMPQDEAQEDGNTQDSSPKEDEAAPLFARAEEYFSGQKKCREHQRDCEQLLNDIEAMMNSVDQDSELYQQLKTASIKLMDMWTSA